MTQITKRNPNKFLKDEFDELLTIREAAEVVGVHPSTIRRRIEKGTFTAFRVGPRLIRVRRSDLERLFNLSKGGS